MQPEALDKDQQPRGAESRGKICPQHRGKPEGGRGGAHVFRAQGERAGKRKGGRKGVGIERRGMNLNGKPVPRRVW